MAKPRMCPHCRAFIDAKATFCEYCKEEIGRPQFRGGSPGGLGAGMIPQTNFAPMIILMINFALFVVTLIATVKLVGETSLFGGVNGSVLRIFGAKDAFLIVNGEWWRLVTAGFLHGGVLHILMNTWVLFDLGMTADHIFGTPRFLVIYLVSSVFGFVASMMWSPGSISVGASAAACGLIGAMIAYGHRSGDSWVRSTYLRWAVVLLAFGLLVPMVDNAAHIGGGVAGFIVGYVAGTPAHSGSTERFWHAAAAASVAVVGVSFFLAYQSFSSSPYF